MLIHLHSNSSGPLVNQECWGVLPLKLLKELFKVPHYSVQSEERYSRGVQ